MGYKEYVEKCIVESGLEEAGELLEILESAETLEDVEAVEGYLTEAKGGLVGAYKGAREKVGERARSKVPTAEERAAANGRSAANNMDYMDFAADATAACNKACSNFDKGAIAVGAAALLAAAAGASLKIRSAIRKSKSGNTKQMESQVKELEDQANDVAKRCKAGEISAKEAKVETKKIEVKIKKLAKDAAKLAKSAVAKVTKESVDITDLQLDIFEAYESGNITENDRDELLGLLEG